MHLWSQSSNVSASGKEVLELLRHAPLTLKVGAKPVLHYQAPMGIWVGSPVHYHLVQGMFKTTWQGTILEASDNSFRVQVAPAFSGPFSSFHAVHELDASEGTVVLRDFIEFDAQDPAFVQSMSSAIGSLSLEGRRWSAQILAEAKTVKFSQIDQSQLG
jgi:hypothetical protein